MVLKSYRIKKLKQMKKRKNSNNEESIISQGAKALIGVGLLSETARAVSRL